MTITDLIELAGDDLKWHTLIGNVTNCTASKKGNRVTFITPFVEPSHLLNPKSSQYIAIVVYLPRDRVPEECQ